MKFVPRNSQIIGRMAIRRSDSKIIRVDETKVTKFILVDAVGDEAAARGVKVGDVVIPTALSNIVFDGGTRFRPILEEKSVACFVTEMSMDDLLVQSEIGAQFVPFESPEAAKSMGAQDAERESEAA